MRFVTCECSCKPDEIYVDGHRPSFYTDPAKVEYIYLKLKKLARVGALRIYKEIEVDAYGNARRVLPELSF